MICHGIVPIYRWILLASHTATPVSFPERVRSFGCWKDTITDFDDAPINTWVVSSRCAPSAGRRASQFQPKLVGRVISRTSGKTLHDRIYDCHHPIATLTSGTGPGGTNGMLQARVDGEGVRRLLVRDGCALHGFDEIATDYVCGLPTAKQRLGYVARSLPGVFACPRV